MEHKKTNHTADELFAMARQQGPVFSSEQVEQMLANFDASGGNTGNKKNRFIQSHLKLIIMTSILTIIGTSLFIFLGIQPNLNPKKNKTAQVQITQATKQSSASSKIPVEGDLRHTTSVVPIAETNLKPDTTTTENVFALTPVPAIANQTSISDKVNAPIIPVAQAPVFIGDSIILDLTDKELMALGIKISENKITYQNHSPENVVSQFSMIQEVKIKGSARFVTSYYPIASPDFKIESSKHDFYAVFLTKINSKSINKTIWEYKSHFDSLPESTIDTLVPVRVKNLNSTEDDYIVWFTTSSNFFEALTIRYKDNVRNFITNVKNAKRQYPKAKLVKYFTLNPVKDKIQSINIIELTSLELEKLGVTTTSEGIYYSAEMPLNQSLGFHITQKGYGVNFNPDIVFPKNIIKMKMGFELKAVSSIDGERPVKWSTSIKIEGDLPEGVPSSYHNNNIYSSNEFASKIDFMVPILLRDVAQYVDSLSPFKNGVIFWFTPTEAFFDSLPAPIAKALRNEYTIVQMLNDPNLTASQKAALPTTCVYFEECRSNLPALDEVMLYPNPAQNNANLKFKLNKASSFEVSLYDITGKPLRLLTSMAPYSIGEQTIGIDLQKVKSGIYMVVLRDTDGHTRSLRLLKQ